MGDPGVWTIFAFLLAYGGGTLGAQLLWPPHSASTREQEIQRHEKQALRRDMEPAQEGGTA